jgi:beta-phosphoglucomutase
VTPRFALVILDLDGVLVNTTPCHARAYADLWDRIGVAGPAYESIAGRTTRDAVRDVAGALGPTAREFDGWVSFKQDRARQYLASEPLLFADTIPALHAIKRRGARLAVGTSASRSTADVVLDRFELRPFFEAIVTGDEVLRGKPAPDIYRRALDLTGEAASRTLVVEDSVAGMAAALEAGTWAVYVRCGLAGEPPRCLGSLADLAALAASREIWGS